ncbi:DNA-processing protein DprA [Paradesulfitobacterium aromaticivorans]
MNIYWLWLTNLKGLGSVTYKRLLDVFGTPKAIYCATRSELDSVSGLKTQAKEIILMNKSLDQAHRLEADLDKHQIRLLTYDLPSYPEAVKVLPMAPVLIYYKGYLRENSIGVGIIGSRRCTEYGKRVTSEAATFLAQQGVTVISGMAKGIDGYAHTACLKAGGYTLTFLGHGLDLCYPKEHESLLEAIIEKGAALSQYPPGTEPRAGYFPQRNTLIAAWSHKILVVEAGVRSGALITARSARGLGRKVLAVPNSIYSPESAGTNRLIAEGAEILTDFAQLVFDVRALPMPMTTVNSELSSLEKAVFDSLTVPKNIEELNDLFNGDIALLNETLCTMELAGRITIGAGNIVRRALPL